MPHVDLLKRHQWVPKLLCFDIDSKKSFMSGQIHMTLSRVTSFVGLFLIDNYKKAVFKVLDKCCK